MSTRWLGTIFVVCTLILMLSGFRTTALGLNDNISELTQLIWGIGGVCCIIGLIKLNALGPNAVARALGFLPLFGFAAFILDGILMVAGFVTPGTPAAFTLAGIGWIPMLAGMLLIGILTIAAKQWHGWRRFVPLLTLALFPVGYGIGGLVGNAYIGTVLGNAPWLLLGYVIATAEPARLNPNASGELKLANPAG